MKGSGIAFSCLTAVLCIGCSHTGGDESISAEERDLALLKTEVHRLNREIEWLHQQITSQQNRLDVTQASPLEQSYNPLRFQGLERKVCSLEAAVEAAGRDLKSLHGTAQETATMMRKLQHDGIGNLEKKVADLSKMRGDVQQLVRALDGDHPTIIAEHSPSIRVKAGDTLEKIARQQGCTVEAIRRANRLKNDKIQVGQSLHLP